MDLKKSGVFISLYFYKRFRKRSKSRGWFLDNGIEKPQLEPWDFYSK